MLPANTQSARSQVWERELPRGNVHTVETIGQVSRGGGGGGGGGRDWRDTMQRAAQSKVGSAVGVALAVAMLLMVLNPPIVQRPGKTRKDGVSGLPRRSPKKALLLGGLAGGAVLTLPLLMNCCVGATM